MLQFNNVQIAIALIGNNHKTTWTDLKLHVLENNNQLKLFYFFEKDESGVAFT